MQPLPIVVRRLWRIAAVVIGLGALVLLAVGDTIVNRSLDPPWPPVVGPVAIAAVVTAIGWLLADLNYKAWRFQLTEDWIKAHWGVISRHTATIPRNRIQTLTSENGPIDRFLGLTSVTVHTAGAGAPNLSIPHLEDATVEWLQGELGRGVSP